ncbi:S-layer homology domain-containing protein [Candidatus Margulisiibacteriota bacterium]
MNFCAFCQATSEAELPSFEDVDKALASVEADIATLEAEIPTQEVKLSPEPPLTERVEIFTDVPADHWAYDAVNELVAEGLTQGYPDGTFRGRNYITRYETAVFLSKMAHRVQIRNAINEKILEELKAEVYKIRYTLDFYKDEPLRRGPVYGRFRARARFGNLISANAAYGSVVAPIGPVFDYRLVTSYWQEFQGGAHIKLTVDTMDSGFSYPRDFVREMLDFEGGVETPHNWGIRLTGGPGTVIHREPTNIFPSEDNTVYLRPKNGATVFYDKDSLDAGIKYQTASITTDGVAAVHDVGFNLGYEYKKTAFGKVKFMYSLDNYANDLRAGMATLESTINMYEMVIYPNTAHKIGLKIGISSFPDTENYYLGGYYVAENIFGADSKFALHMSRIGEQFLNAPGDLDQDDILGVNLFDKLLRNGTYDIGTEIAHKVGEGRAFRIKGGLVLGKDGQYDASETDAEATIEINMDYGMFEDAVMTIGYRIYQKPSLTSNTTSDILGIGFNYLY